MQKIFELKHFFTIVVYLIFTVFAEINAPDA